MYSGATKEHLATLQANNIGLQLPLTSPMLSKAAKEIP